MSEAAGGLIRVAIADDEPDIRRLLRRMLELDGRFEIVGEAEDGREAVDLCKGESPDAVVLDLMMPVMDGLEAIPLIRVGSPDTKIVVLSAFGTSDIRAKALAGGASIFLEKGEAVKDLIDALVRLTA